MSITKNQTNIGRRILYMKSTGIVRKVDQLGRIVIPKELRSILEISDKDALEIYVDGKKVILQKYEPSVDLQEKIKLLAELEQFAKLEMNPNKKDAMIRAIALIQ